MPTKPPKACNRPGCRGLVRDGVCNVCGPLRRQRDKEIDDRRGSSASRGYGYSWRRWRAMYLRSHRLCVICLRNGRVEPATDVHHIIPKRDGGLDIESNLQALCHSCHSRITNAGG